MNYSQRIAAAITALIVVLLVLLLFTVHLKWEPGKPWPPEPEPFIELAQEEFIEPEPIPLPKGAPGELTAAAQLPEHVDEPSKTAPETGTQLKNEGPKAEPAKVVTTQKESTVKAEKKEQPKKTGTPKETKKEEKKPSAERTAVKNMFDRANGKHNSDNRTGDAANAGKPSGKPDSAGPANSNSTVSGIVPGKLGGGWQWPAFSHISASMTGTVILSFVVDANGRATKIKAVGGKAPAAANSAIKQQCINELRKRTFTRPASAGAPDPETEARLTFVFK